MRCLFLKGIQRHCWKIYNFRENRRHRLYSNGITTLTKNIPKNCFHRSEPTAFYGHQHNILLNSDLSSREPHLVVKIYRDLRKFRTNLDRYILATVLKATGILSMILLGSEIHGLAIRCGLMSEVFVVNALIQMYAACERFVDAREIFDTNPHRDEVSWSILIASYVKHKMFKDSLQLIKDMRKCNVIPSEGGIVSMVSLSADLQETALGTEIHAFVIKSCPNKNLGQHTSTSLIDMYGKCGNLKYATRVFDRMNTRCVVAWSSIISGYIRYGDLEKADNLLFQMFRAGCYPNEIAMLSFIIACGVSKAIELGKKLHVFHIRNGFHIPTKLVIALIEMYGRCGDTKTARNLFDTLEKKGALAWTAIICTYAQACLPDVGFSLFSMMINMGEKPIETTMLGFLQLCVESGEIEKAKWLHGYIIKNGFETNLVLRTALVDTYSKSGDIFSAKRLFTDLNDRDTGLWNAMITGLGMHGFGNDAITIFEEMKRQFVEPDGITFVGIVHACAHTGLVKEGRHYFKEMVTRFGISPKIEHYGCMVDLLGRAGLLDEAIELIKNMAMKPNVMVWGSLLAACKIHKNTELAESASKEILKLEPYHKGYSTLMANVYAAANKWKKVASVRSIIKEGGVMRQGF